MGRPSDFTQDIADEICQRLAHGESLRAICRDDAMPGLSTVIRWRAQNEAFRTQYACAREDQADALADEIVEIADGEEHPDSRRVRVDARKWVASKLRPKTYGDKQQHEHSGTVSLTISPTDAAL